MSSNRFLLFYPLYPPTGHLYYNLDLICQINQQLLERYFLPFLHILHIFQQAAAQYNLQKMQDDKSHLFYYASVPKNHY